MKIKDRFAIVNKFENPEFKVDERHATYTQAKAALRAIDSKDFRIVDLTWESDSFAVNWRKRNPQEVR